METFKKYWEEEVAKRKKRWPSRFKSYTGQHLSHEEIRSRTFTSDINERLIKQIKASHECYINPLLTLDGNGFSEHRLRDALISLGADLSTFNMTIAEKKECGQKNTQADISLGRVTLRIDKTSYVHLNKYQIIPCLQLAKGSSFWQLVKSSFTLAENEFVHVNIATLLMEMAADYELRGEEFIYYSKRLRLFKMDAAIVDGITFDLPDEEKLTERLKNYAQKKYIESRMLKEVARPWLQATKKYITLINENNKDKMWNFQGDIVNDQIQQSTRKDLRPMLRDIVGECLVFADNLGTIFIEYGDSNYRFATSTYDYNNVTLQPIKKYPFLTIRFHGICNETIVGYIEQSLRFEHSLIQFLEKARMMYSKITGKGLRKERPGATQTMVARGSAIIGHSNKQLGRIIVPEGTTLIDDGVFQSLGVLTDISLPDSVAYIGKEAFAGCSTLKEIRLPNQLMIIRAEGFSSCSNLREIVLPPRLAIIEEKAFSYCYRLRKVTFPESIVAIRHEAFKYCESLEELHFLSKKPGLMKIDRNAFDDYIYENVDVFVPKDEYVLYMQYPVFKKMKRLLVE